MDAEPIDPANPVVILCARGVAAEGVPSEARRLFEHAWAARHDDYDAAIAAHFLARHQETAADRLRWNLVALRHAEAAPYGKAASFLASLYLNLGDAQASVGDMEAAAESVARAAGHLSALARDGYRDFVVLGIRRLAARVGVLAIATSRVR